MPTRLLIWTILPLAILLTILIYWPGVHGGFLLDDYSNIVHNSALQIQNLQINTLLAAAFSSHSGPLDRPLSMLSFALDEYFWGPGPYAMKATNIFIHALNGIPLFTVTFLILKAYRQRFRPDLDSRLIAWTALAITSAWLLLPINLTAVLYIVQRMTSLSGTFVLIAVALYLKGRLRMLEGCPGFWLIIIGTVIFGPLAVLAKESGALLPVYTLLLEWILFGFTRKNGYRDTRLYLFYFLTLVLPGILGMLWLGTGAFSHGAYAGRLFDLDERLLTEARVVVLYMVWTLLPNLSVLSLYHDDFPVSTSLLSPPTTLLSIIILALLISLAFWQRRDRPLLSIGIFWFLGGQLLTATIFPLELVFEHRNYLPDFGLLLALFSLTLLEAPVQRLALPRRLLIIGLIALYGLITGLRVHIWSNPIRYAVIAAANHPNSPRATYELGRTYAQLVDSAQSPLLPLADKALEHAAAVPHASILPLSALLIMHAKLNLPLKSSWWHGIENKLSQRSATAQDINGLTAMVYCAMGGCRFPQKDMTRVFQAAFSKSPESANIITIYTNYVLNVLHNYPLALRLMHLTVKLSPNTSQFWINLARLDIYFGHFKSAEMDIRHLQRHNHLHHLDDAIKSLRQQLAKARKIQSQEINRHK